MSPQLLYLTLLYPALLYFILPFLTSLYFTYTAADLRPSTSRLSPGAFFDLRLQASETAVYIVLATEHTTCCVVCDCAV